MKTKKISELTMMETVSDAANVLVEENGEAKRVPAGKMVAGSLPEHLQFGDDLVTLFEGEYDFTDMDGMPSVMVDGFADQSGFAGNEYTVVWDGVEYAATAQAMGTGTWIGNPAAMGGEDDGCPFVIMFMPGGGAMVGDVAGAMSGVTSSTHTVKVSTVSAICIDPKYVPVAVLWGGNEDVNGTIVGRLYRNPNDRNENTNPITHEQLKELVERNVLLKITDGTKTYLPTEIHIDYSFPHQTFVNVVRTTTGTPSYESTDMKLVYYRVSEYTPS